MLSNWAVERGWPSKAVVVPRRPMDPSNWILAVVTLVRSNKKGFPLLRDAPSPAYSPF